MAFIKTNEELKSKYRCVKINGKKKDTHRFIMESILGRTLDRDEVVHHKDGNSLNNTPDNLEVMTRSEHAKLHGKNKHLSAVTKERLHNAIVQGMREHKKGFHNKAVKAYNALTGELVKEYISVHEAERDGFHNWAISLCLKGRRKTHKGMVWKLA